MAPKLRSQKRLRRPRRLLYASNSFTDAVRHRTTLLQSLSADGWSIHLLLPSADRCPHNLTYPVASLPFAAKTTLHPIDLLGILRIAWAVLTYRPDIIHARGIKTALLAGIASCWSRRTALIGHICGLGRMAYRPPGVAVHLLAAGVGLGFAGSRRALVCQNRHDMSWFQRRIPRSTSRLVLIKGSGVDTQRVAAVPEPSGPIRIVLASRMLRSKGISVFAEAARSLKGRVPNGTEFILVGDIVSDDPDSHTEAELRSWTESGAVNWVGWQRDPLAWIAQSHIVCLPTAYGEGIPRVLLEGALIGRALVATSAPGCDEICRHEVTGLVVPTGDSLALAEALYRLITDTPRRLSMGQAARTLAETEFSNQTVFGRFVALHRILSHG